MLYLSINSNPTNRKFILHNKLVNNIIIITIKFIYWQHLELVVTEFPFYLFFWCVYRFLNKAAIIRPEDEINKDGSPSDPWSLCSVQQVEEAKCLVRVMPIWLSALVYHVAIVQQQTYVVFQALQSDRRLANTNFEIPAASYIVFSMLSLTLFIPIYDRLVVPFLQRVRAKEGGITLLQRIGIGILVSVALSLLSGLVETHCR